MPNQDLGFSPSQKRVLRFALVGLSVLALVGILVGIIWALGRAVSILQALVFPLAIAGILALILSPIVQLFEKHLHLSRLFSVIFLFVIITLILTGGLVFIIPVAVEQITQFAKTVPDLIAQGREFIGSRFPNALPVVEDAISEIDVETVAPDFQDVSHTTLRYIGLLGGLGFVPLYLFFALLSGDRLRERIKEELTILSETAQKELIYMAQIFIGYLTAFFRGQLVIALIMGVIMAVGFTVVGLSGGILFGLVLGLLNIVPYLGFVVGMLTVLPVAMIQEGGGMQLAGLVLGVVILTQTIESFFLTPKIMADRSGLHPALVVVSVIFWGTLLNGVVGMILAVPLTAFFLSLWHHFKQQAFAD